MENKTVYLDNSATTKVDDAVVEYMRSAMVENYGNPSSLHHKGQKAKEFLDKSRQILAEKINAKSSEIYFTSGGTEADNLAIIGYCLANKDKGNHIITSKIEHPAVLESFKELEKQGFEVTYLDVEKDGLINITKFESKIKHDTFFASIMHANNEIGVIQDIETIGKICRSRKIIFHTDAVQSFLKTEIDVERMNIDMASFSSHKIHGPKGVGALYVKKGIKVKSMQFGGAQESKIRSGTENMPGIAGFSKAIEMFNLSDLKKMSEIRNYLIKELSKIEGSTINGNLDKRLVNNVHITFDFIEGEALLLYLDIEGICVSTGSACSSKSLKPSHVLMAIGKKPEQSHGSIRISLSKYNTKEDADYLILKLNEVVSKLRKMSPFKVNSKADIKKTKWEK